MKITTAIVTYEKRYKEYFLPLIDSIKQYEPILEVIIAVNGEYKKTFNNTYRENILNTCAKYSNTYPQVYTSFQSLAKLWNRIILTSSNNLVLVLNDDVSIKPQFFNFLAEQEQTFCNKLTLFNGVFSNFIVDRNYLSSLNWFDERFLGIGKEDRDIQRKTNCYNLNTDLIRSYHIETTDPIDNMEGYGGKYSLFNDQFFKDKWEFDKYSEAMQYPYYNFELSNRNKL